ncbi:MAG: hypothetical protein V9E81_15805 [Marmoricola sp.]
MRGIRRRELLRISVADLTEDLSVVDVGTGLTDLTSATLESALRVATHVVEADRKAALLTQMALVAMGRYGGGELGYGSDADVMFVHDPHPDADPQLATSMATAVANEVRRLLAMPATDPALEVDADLRPEGRQGPLVRTIASYGAYYAKWSAINGKPRRCCVRTPVWVIWTCASDSMPSSSRCVTRARGSASTPHRDSPDQARVDAERLPRGADPATHFKLGRRGLADIEWCVQVLQMRHAHAVEGLRTLELWLP